MVSRGGSFRIPSRNAAYALRQGKEVYAAPGDMYSRAFLGSNRFISQGTPEAPGNELQDGIIEILKGSPMTMDELAMRLRIDDGKLIEVLFSLEIENRVKNVAGRYVGN